MNRFIITILSLFIICISVSAQNNKQQIKYADKLVKQNNYYGASIYYKKAMDIDSSDIHLIYKLATSLKNYNNYTLAQFYFAKICEKDKGGRIYKDAQFWLASMQKYNADYKSSLHSWKKTKSLYKKDKKSYHYKKAAKEISSCIFAIRNINDSINNINVSHLGKEINTTDSEFSGKINNEKLEFSSLRSDSVNAKLEIFQDAYKVKIYQDNKDTILALDSTINNINFHNANGVFSKDNKHYYFSRCDSITGCKIYVSKFINNTYSTPAALSSNINVKGANTSHPHIAEIDGNEYIFYSSDRKGTYGKMDIWYSKILDGPSFSNAINAGKNINSLDNEITPFYHSASNTLYFSSTWHNGFGGFDVFKSVYHDNIFGVSENLSQPINTSCNDIYYWLNKNGNKGYLTSNRLGIYYSKGETCCNDIWEIENTDEDTHKEFTNKITSLDDLNKYLPVTLYFHNDRPGPKTLDTTVNISYITAYNRYKALQRTYQDEYSSGLSGNKETEARLDIDDFFKHYVDKGVKDLNLFTKLLLIELEKGEIIELTVKGFASPLAKTAYNVNLTKRRISSLINLLKKAENGKIKKYIDDKHLIFEDIPFGEYTANSNVSDDYHDQKNSIYNRSAALERKIEIQTIKLANPKDSVFAEIYTEMCTYDFGKLKQGEIVEHTFIITNTGEKDLIIKQIEKECSCTSTDITESKIKPNQKTEINVIFNTKGLIGKQAKSITIIADAFPTTKRLVFTSEIFIE